MSVGAVGNVGMSGVDLKGLDLETAMMMVQTKRTELLESQLKDQIDQVSKRNDQIAKLNETMAQLNALNARFDGDAKSTDKLNKIKDWNKDGKDVPVREQLVESANAAGLNLKGMNIIDGNGHLGNATKGDVDAAIQKIKGLIDAESNSQQMDMLRLQSLSNKRNEAFDLMTNFIKKMNDGRASIIANMR